MLLIKNNYVTKLNHTEIEMSITNAKGISEAEANRNN